MINVGIRTTFLVSGGLLLSAIFPLIGLDGRLSYCRHGAARVVVERNARLLRRLTGPLFPY